MARGLRNSLTKSRVFRSRRRAGVTTDVTLMPTPRHAVAYLADARVGYVRRMLSLAFGFVILAVVVAGAWLAETPTRDIRDVGQLRQQGERLRPTGPHGPPQLVPPRAPGPGVST